MNILLLYHSALSDWNHGNAHFLRGVATELQARGHAVTIGEPSDAWSAHHLVADHGQAALEATRTAYPSLQVTRYEGLHDLEPALDRADLVIVHEWNTPDLVAAVGRLQACNRRYTLLFHDTHHRSVSDGAGIAAYDLRHYDGVLAFGEVIRQHYLENGWSARAWTWHEAADTRVFRPLPAVARERDLVWVGNWGDDERTAELYEYLIAPVRAAGCSASVHGVRYPPAGLAALASARIAYHGWLPNYRVPEAFARHRVTVHVPRRPYVTQLPGVPTIRPFEALACGIPLVTAPWDDTEHLFRPGVDYLVARNSAEMTRHLRAVLHDTGLAASVAASGLETIRARHTCAHRVDELLGIVAELRGSLLPAAVSSGVAEAVR